MRALSTMFFIAAYLLAVADGAMQDKGLYPSSPGRMGIKGYAKTHPWIVAGAVCGVVGTILAA
jgi:hypothetical protein